MCACSCRSALWLVLLQSSGVSLHMLLLAVCFQLLFAFVACIGAGLWCEPAQVDACCVIAAIACLCGFYWCRALVSAYTSCCLLCPCSCRVPWWRVSVQGSGGSLHKLLLAVWLQLLFAFVACFGAGLLCEPANLAARCVPAAVVCLCGLLWCRVLV